MTMFSFESLEDMQEFLKDQNAAAKAAMTKEQETLTWGSYVIMPTTDFVIFGYIFTEEEVRLGEINAGGSQEEVEWTLQGIRAAFERGHLFGRWHSIVELEGELGSNHAVNCWPIDSHTFNIAATFGWDAAAMVRAPEGVLLLDAYIAFAKGRVDRGSKN